MNPTAPTNDPAPSAPAVFSPDDKNVVVEETRPDGQTGFVNLATVMNRLSACGFPAWETRQRLLFGEAITTQLGHRFEVQAAHRRPKTWRARIDDPVESFKVVGQLLDRHPKARAALEIFLADMVSTLNNHAQVLTLRGEAWGDEAERTSSDEDLARASLFSGRSEALAWVAGELQQLLGRAPRSIEERAFEFARAWKAEPEEQPEAKPTHDELEAERGFDEAKERRLEQLLGGN